MENSEWENHLREMLEKFKPVTDSPDWEAFAQRMNSEAPSDGNPDLSLDETLKETLSNFKPSSAVEGWDRIEASLNAEHAEFDRKVREKIHQYQPRFDPHSWSEFLKHLSSTKLLRIKLIALKTVEFAAVLLVILTVVQMGRMGKLPFETPLFEDSPHLKSTVNPGTDKALFLPPSSDTRGIANAKTPSASEEPTPVTSLAEAISSSHLAYDAYPQMHGNSSSASGSSGGNEKNKQYQSPTTAIPVMDMTTLESSTPVKRVKNIVPPQYDIPTSEIKSVSHPSGPDPNAERRNSVTGSLAMLSSGLSGSRLGIVPVPAYIRSPNRTYLEFGIISQVDYNRLRMPEDRLYSSGKQIVFPQQGIPSHGYGTGFTLAIGHPLWALETGIIYNAKNFKPGRQLIVGGAFDNGIVDFEAMRLQVVSVPIQYRYRFEPKGRLKTYALAGFGLHIIAQSDIDVLIKYHPPSLSFGENPNNDPNLAYTERETRRISEHIRDGAPFSSKSFFSANAGLGLEYTLTPHKTLFFQSAIQYQIPNLHFSNNNGKHIRSISLQAGVRTPLGT